MEPKYILAFLSFVIGVFCTLIINKRDSYILCKEQCTFDKYISGKCSIIENDETFGKVWSVFDDVDGKTIKCYKLK